LRCYHPDPVLYQISEDPAFRELMAASGEALGVDLGEIFTTEVMTAIDE
jgi:hypothetical protein